MVVNLVTNYKMNLDGSTVDYEGTEEHDLVIGNADSANVAAGAGDDVIVTSTLADVIDAGAGNDYVFSDNPPNSIASFKTPLPLLTEEFAWIDENHERSNFALRLRSTLPAGIVAKHFPIIKDENGKAVGSDDIIYAGAGRDLVFSGPGNDTVYAGNKEGSDNADDFIDGGEGDDKLYADSAGDWLFGGKGNDTLDASNAIAANPEANRMKLDGGIGHNTVIASNDVNMLTDIITYGGNDTIIGGKGNEQVIDHGGDNLFVLSAGADWIGASLGHDIIEIPHAILANADGEMKVDFITADARSIKITWTDKDGVDHITRATGIDEITVKDAEGKETERFNLLELSGEGLGGLDIVPPQQAPQNKAQEQEEDVELENILAQGFSESQESSASLAATSLPSINGAGKSVVV